MSPLAVLCLLPALAGADPDFDLIRGQIRAGKIEKDKWIGHRDSGREVRTTHDGGVLVGFEVGVTERFDNRWIVAVRPIYRTPNGVFAGEELGSFDPKVHTDGAVKKHGIRRIELIARPGYAVEAVHTMNSIGFIHFSLTYAKTTESGLDPTDTYDSEEVGRSREGQAFVGTTRTNGKFGVGALGHVHNNIVFAMNLLHLKDGGLKAVASERPPLSDRDRDRDVKPAPLPAESKNSVPGVQPMSRAELPEIKPADLPPPEPRPEPAPKAAAEPPKQPDAPAVPPGFPVPVVAVTSPDEIKTAVFAKKPEQAEPAATSSVPSWVAPAAVGGGVTIVVVGLLLLIGGGGKKSADRPRRTAPPVARAAPAEKLPRARRVE